MIAGEGSFKTPLSLAQEGLALKPALPVKRSTENIPFAGNPYPGHTLTTRRVDIHHGPQHPPRSAGEYESTEVLPCHPAHRPASADSPEAERSGWVAEHCLPEAPGFCPVRLVTQHTACHPP